MFIGESLCTIFFIIGISDTVSDGAAKTLVLNIERAQQYYLSQRF